MKIVRQRMWIDVEVDKMLNQHVVEEVVTPKNHIIPDYHELHIAQLLRLPSIGRI